MNCANHAEAQNVAFCIRCGKPLCNECIRNIRGSVYCEPCLADVVEGKAPPAGAGFTGSAGSAGAAPSGASGASGAARQQVAGGTNPGAAFALGLIPGVGAIYNAEYFKAAVHILIFGTLISLGDSGPRATEPLFGLMIFGFYVYMPFEAYYTAKKRKMKLEQGIDLETPFDQFNDRIGEIRDKELWGGVILVFIGGLFLLDNFDILSIDRLFRLWPVALIVAGVFLLKRFQEKEKASS